MFGARTRQNHLKAGQKKGGFLTRKCSWCSRLVSGVCWVGMALIRKQTLEKKSKRPFLACKPKYIQPQIKRNVIFENNIHHVMLIPRAPEFHHMAPRVRLITCCPKVLWALGPKKLRNSARSAAQLSQSRTGTFPTRSQFVHQKKVKKHRKTMFFLGNKWK